MPKDLMPQEVLDEICPCMVAELEEFVADEEIFKDADEAIIYALCQMLHNRVNKLDFSLEDKGSLVSSLISGLIEFNQEPLAAYNSLVKSIREQRASTLH